MIRSLKTALEVEQMKYAVPRSVQVTIPVHTVHEDGIFEFTGKGIKRFSACYSFTDINYFSVSQEERETLFGGYCAFLNSLDPSATYKITVVNGFINQLEFETNVLIPVRNDDISTYRTEYNRMLQSKIDSNSHIVQNKYITVTVARKNIDEARSFFQRVGSELRAQLDDKLKSHVEVLDAHARLRLLHDFFRAGEEIYYNFDMKASAKRGHDWKDYICPDGMEIRSDYIRIGEKWARALYLSDYANYLRDNMIRKMTELNKQLILSVDYIPVQTHEAVQEVQKVLLGVNTNIVNYNKRQIKDQTFTSIPYSMQQQKDETQAFLQALTEHDERMIFGLLTVVHVADSKEELDADTDSLMAIAREHVCQFVKPFFRQIDALNTAIPYGIRPLPDVRTMTTSSAATFIPFRSPRLQDKSGIYYGSNPLTKEMILCNRKQLINANGFIFGKAGGGKSMSAKAAICATALGTKDDIFIFDPEREYGGLIKALGGEVIRISATSTAHINAMDISEDYGEDANPVVSKTQFILSLCADILGGMDAKEQSLIDRCAGRVLRKYVQAGYKGKTPTLADLHAELLKQPETEAKDTALRLEVFVNGSLSTFAEQTNVKMDGRIICFDLKDLGSQLKTLGMLIVLDAIINKVSRNRTQGKYTWVYVDEFHVFTANEYARRFFISFWKRARKYGGILTGITQNVGDLMRSEDTQDIISNSEFLVLLAQAPTDRDKFADMLHLAPEQVKYIHEARIGRGLLKCGNNILPFENEFPKDTELYKLMTTRIDEQ
ncbi:MAG TPA: ATP-binding protein [Clostridia bacterium]|nr:ATP-binding protein [Clostridia bacterium]